MMAARRLVPLAAAFLALSGVASRAGEEAGGEEAGKPKGLTAELVKRKITRSFGDRERSFDALVLVVTNGGDATVLLPSPLEVKLSAKDAEGKEVPSREAAAPAGGGKEEEQGVTLTVLKTGQKVEVDCRPNRLNFPKVGKYTVRAEVKVEPTGDEVLPGMKLWSGELKSNELEWDVQRLRGRRGGGAGRRGGGAAGGTTPAQPEPKPAEKPDEAPNF